MTMSRRGVGPTTRRRSQRGAAAVEFALVSTVLVTLLFGILQYGWYFFSTQVATNAARDTARRLSVGDCTGANEARDHARALASRTDLLLTWGPSAAPTTNSYGTMTVGDQLAVTVQLDASVVGLLPMPSGGQVSRTVKAQLEDTASGNPC